ncbi:hypothetical protein PV773_08265 [Mesorhizobium sp. CC13]|uniref:hypothetical protein n=1 Tax=Mesorhizobium sp. CC13 TaxID=3029194 RepID=UPI0032631415
MRRVVVPLIILAALLPASAMAQDLSAPQQTQPFQVPALDPDQVYSDVVVIQFETLPPSTQKEVGDIVNETDAAQLKELQSVVGNSRQAVLTLASVGLDPSQVVAAGVTDEGVLTLVVQQTA